MLSPWPIWAWACTALNICAHILYVCTCHDTSVQAVCTWTQNKFNSPWNNLLNFTLHWDEATFVHRDKYCFEFPSCSGARHMSETSWRPLSISAVWCGKSQLEWRAVVWVAAWQRLHWTCLWVRQTCMWMRPMLLVDLSTPWRTEGNGDVWGMLKGMPMADQTICYCV